MCYFKKLIGISRKSFLCVYILLTCIYVIEARVILWRSVLLTEETGAPVKYNRFVWSY